VKPARDEVEDETGSTGFIKRVAQRDDEQLDEDYREFFAQRQPRDTGDSAAVP
jgi:hypothetical protein